MLISFPTDMQVFVSFTAGDVLSGTDSGGEHHYGVLEGWFGMHWWNGRFFILLVTTLCIFTPLACLKRIGKQMIERISSTALICIVRLMDIWFPSTLMCSFILLQIH